MDNLEIVVDSSECPGDSENDTFYDAEETGATWIPIHLFSDKPEAYEPQKVSLGRSHLGQSQLEEYENIKKDLPEERFPHRFHRFKELVQNLTDDRRCCLLNVSDLNGEKLGSMMARDGLFLLQFLREMSPRTDYEKYLSFVEIQPFGDQDDVLNVEKNVTRKLRPKLQLLLVQEDIMKLQNQIPFFVLKRIVQWEAETYEEMKQMMPQQKADTEKNKMLRDMILQARTGTNQDFDSILKKAWSSLSPFPDMHDQEDKLVVGGDSSHILGFVYKNIIGSSQSTYPKHSGTKKNKGCLARAVALDNKGVKFTPHKGLLNETRFDAKNYTFHLPRIEIDERTDAVMRNLVAFELSVCTDKMKPIRCYVELMDQLIDKAEDVEVLKNSGIIHNRLSTDQEVADIWNGLRKGLEPHGEYGPIDTAIDDAITFYGSYRIWYAEFTKKYLSKPWLVVSLVAGCIIMLLGILQTVLSWEQLHQ